MTAPARFAALAALAVSLLAAPGARADEGMWLLTSPPTAAIKARYGYEVAPQWLERMQKSAVRFSTDGSASLVSADGLVMTNHHVGSDMLLKLSTPSRNLLQTGFYAPTREAELKCPDLEVNILWEIEDVTASVTGAEKSGMTAAEANTARRRTMAEIERGSQERTGLLSQIVTLYQGGRYHLYRYKRFTDVRLVWAPEEAIAFFGGDTDNFEYPRFCLDATFFRIYEDGKPFKPQHHLSWSPGGAADGELVFVFGHPGRTSRMFTVDHLRFDRDVANPWRLANLWRTEIQLQTFSGRSAENARVAREDLFGVANSRKAITGETAGLQDPVLIARKQKDEDALRAFVAKSPDLAKQIGDPWADLRKAHDGYRAWYAEDQLIHRLPLLRSDLFGRAMTIVRLADELPKPNADRLREYRDSDLENVYLELYSPAPISEKLEIAKIRSSLALMAERLGAEHPLVARALGGKSPQARAEELVRGSTLFDPAARRAMVEGGTKAVEASTEPLIRLARELDAENRAARTRFEDTVEAVERDAYARIAKARFAMLGESTYPDATFTLRLAYGPVKGYTDEGAAVPPFTDFSGLYRRADERRGQEGFELPARWVEARSRLNLSTPFNFVCTADIIGGNSGSPVVNGKGEVVGLIFDGNIQSLVADFIYDEAQNRAVAVDSRGILEALDKVYGAAPLVKELKGQGN
ncbi:MAG: S46 family peptidase [Phycisphaerales bacterium]|nr:S46 family peptidase [Phycisphaerales bacterium]